MRRLLRILLNAATVLSLVLCVVTMGAWVRSYQVGEMWTRGHDEIGADTRRHWLWQFASAGGSVAYFVNSTDVRGLGDFDPQVLADLRAFWSVPANRETRRYNSSPGSKGRATFGLSTTLGFGFKYRPGAIGKQSTGSSWTWLVTIPYWAVTGACGLALSGCLWYGRRQRRRDQAARDIALQRCPACGYDCRGTPDRCPECGRATANEASR